MNNYLEKIDKYLKPLPFSERFDIVKEIKSTMLEMRSEGKSSEEIIERLGNPRDLARSYLGDLINTGSFLTWKKALAVFAFYSLTGITGLAVIPVLAICAPVFIVSGVFSIVVGIIKIFDSVLGINSNIMTYVGVKGINSPILDFLACETAGIILCLAAYGCWKLLGYYFKAISKIASKVDTLN